MQVKAAGAAECRIRARDVAAPSALAEGFIPPRRPNPSRSVARAENPHRHGRGSFIRQPAKLDDVIS